MKLRGYIKDFFLDVDGFSVYGTKGKKKSILLNFFLYTYLIVAIAFVIYDGIFYDKILFLVDIIATSIGLVLLYLFKVKKKLDEAAAGFVISIFFLVSFLGFQGGVNNSGIVFSLLVPLINIALLGRKWGRISLYIFGVVIVGGFVLLHNMPWFPNYDWVYVSRLAIVFLLIAIIAYSNEYVFEELYKKLEKVSESLKISQQHYKNMAVNKEKFVSLISHNLGDHVASFKGIANLLDEEYDEMNEQQRRELIHNLSNISNQNYKLLQDLMKWSTVQNEIIPFSPKPIKLEKIYREVTELFNPLIEEKKLSFFLKMKSNSMVFADEHMVGSIMRSLVSNAIKFSHVNGEVRISADEENDKMIVTVTDNGKGMSRFDLLRINSSVSFSNPGTLDESGTGIGLILVKEFLQKNRGTLFVESKKDQGTEVRFTLPLAE